MLKKKCKNIFKGQKKKKRLKQSRQQEQGDYDLVSPYKGYFAKMTSWLLILSSLLLGYLPNNK